MALELNEPNLFLNPENDDVIINFRKNNPEESEKYKIKRRRFALNEAQRNEILQIAEKRKVLHYLMMRIQMETGMRVGELTHLIIPNCFLDTDNPFIEIQSRKATKHQKAWKTKSKAGNRSVYISADLAYLLKFQIAGRKVGFVFLSQKDTPFHIVSARRFTNYYAKQCKSIGFNIGTHSLRRTFASFQLKSGKSIGSLKNDLGHKSIATTMRYLFEIEDVEEKQKTAEYSAKMHDIKTSQLLIARLQEDQQKHVKAMKKKEKNQTINKTRDECNE